MRWHLVTSLSTIHSNDSVSVDGITLVWVDDNAKQSRIGLFEELKDVKVFKQQEGVKNRGKNMKN